MSTKPKSKSTTPKNVPASICWFEIPADDPERAKKFYGSLFGWKINPFPGMENYWHIDTGGGDQTPDGGLMKRMHEGQPITSYVMVPSVTRYMAKIKKLGGDVCVAKTPVKGMGYLAICNDPEGNTFAIWEVNDRAK